MYSAIALCLLLQAPQPPGPPPKWTPPVPDKRPKAVALGLLGARGESHPGRRVVTVTKVYDNSPGRAADLRVGDEIIYVGGRRLSGKSNTVYQLIDRVEEATAAAPGKKKAPALAITVQRDGKKVKLKVPFPALGPHARDCTGTCSRCATLTKQSLDWLATQQLKDGSFDKQWDAFSKKVSMCSVAAIAFLASGSTPDKGPYADNLRRARDYVIETAGREYKLPAGTANANTSMVNWPLAYGTIFLALSYKRTPDQESKVKIQVLADTIVANQEKSGGWAHGPGGMNAGGYLELQILGDLCLTALGLARQVGCNVNYEAINRGLAYLDRCTAKEGGVNYSADPRQVKGRGEAGRTAGALVAYQAIGATDHANYPRSLAYFQKRVDKLHGGHGGIVIHYLAGAMASHAEGAKAWATYRTAMRHELLLARLHDGTFSYRYSTENDDPKRSTDKVHGPIWTTASHLIIEQLPLGHLDWTP